MVSPKPKTKLTYEDYAKTPDDERWELIDGELFRMPSPNIAHQRTSMRLAFAHGPVCGRKRPGRGLRRANGCCAVGHGHRGAGLAVHLQGDGWALSPGSTSRARRTW